MTQAIDIVFNFDTTGSMYPCLRNVRDQLENIVTTLFKELPDLRIGIGANGDYCDKGRPYITKHTDLTSDLHPLTQFVRNVEVTGGGGNGGEAYELVLQESQTKYSWRDQARKILVMIGDEIAHTPEYAQRAYGSRIDWRSEAMKLRNMGVEVFTIQCLDQRYQRAHEYYPELAEIGGGQYLRLDQFSDIVELVMAITYYQVGTERVEQYEKEVALRKTISRSLDRSFNVLTGRKQSDRFVARTDGLVPVAPGRFQILNVPSDCVIKNFVQDNQLVFKTGRGFYEFTKKEEIQEKKEVVLRERTTGDMFSGEEARRIIGLPYGTRGNIKPNATSNYQVFVQSTSYNRKLIGNTQFLYEVDNDA